MHMQTGVGQELHADMTTEIQTTEKATFGAGCFWGVEAAFRQIKGVKATAVGFMGGHQDNPSYEDVCYKSTGHAEVVEVEYDPALVSYETLLDVFWENHDPTTLNRQGPDIGEQYRSAIFFHTRRAARRRRSLEAAPRVRRPLPPPDRHRDHARRDVLSAEDYHQQYLEKRGLSTCHI